MKSTFSSYSSRFIILLVIPLAFMTACHDVEEFEDIQRQQIELVNQLEQVNPNSLTLSDDDPQIGNTPVADQGDDDVSGGSAQSTRIRTPFIPTNKKTKLKGSGD